MRVRYGDIHLNKQLPQGGWLELNLREVNHLRKEVDMPRETETKVRIDDSKMKNGQSRIRKAVKKHKQHRKASCVRQRTVKTRTRN